MIFQTARKSEKKVNVKETRAHFESEGARPYFAILGRVEGDGLEIGLLRPIVDVDQDDFGHGITRGALLTFPIAS